MQAKGIPIDARLTFRPTPDGLIPTGYQVWNSGSGDIADKPEREEVLFSSESMFAFNANLNGSSIVSASVAGQNSMYRDASCVLITKKLVTFTGKPQVKEYVDSVKNVLRQKTAENRTHRYLEHLRKFGTHYATSVKLGGVWATVNESRLLNQSYDGAFRESVRGNGVLSQNEKSLSLIIKGGNIAITSLNAWLTTLDGPISSLAVNSGKSTFVKTLLSFGGENSAESVFTTAAGNSGHSDTLKRIEWNYGNLTVVDVPGLESIHPPKCVLENFTAGRYEVGVNLNYSKNDVENWWNSLWIKGKLEDAITNFVVIIKAPAKRTPEQKDTKSQNFVSPEKYASDWDIVERKPTYDVVRSFPGKIKFSFVVNVRADFFKEEKAVLEEMRKLCPDPFVFTSCKGDIEEPRSHLRVVLRKFL
ncbi:hypothetical protein HDU84_002756 [Entophlyctis sp. JEL0112]|nr:hypothetical protein HDU84_002756 [Entophlyctis sp. JEL0112]